MQDNEWIFRRRLSTDGNSAVSFKRLQRFQRHALESEVSSGKIPRLYREQLRNGSPAFVC
jgi:hypothetical protein